MVRYFFHTTLALVIFTMIMAAPGVGGDGRVDYSYEFIPVIIVTHPDTIKILLDEFAMAEDKVDSLTIYDVDAQGAGLNDVVKVHPSQKIYPITEFRWTEKARKIMRNWVPPKPKRMTGSPEYLDTYRQESVEKQDGRYSILSTLLAGLQKNYSGSEVKLFFSLKPEGFEFQMVGYNPDALTFSPPLVSPDATSIVQHDTLGTMPLPEVLRLLYESLRKQLDIQPVVIYKEVETTHYLNEPKEKQKSKPQGK
ncbi:MAG: hypothetical protein ONB05_07775 [candidate division KSB1 bacterium]|nr:hypothetical protein [candidate division KSB1 bacterium]